MNKFYKKSISYYKFDLENQTFLQLSAEDTYEGANILYSYGKEATIRLHDIFVEHMESGSMAILEKNPKISASDAEQLVPILQKPIEITEEEFNQAKERVMAKINIALL
jgi:hypothetical protein